jgi:tungstate transport system substrate-binding protein
MNRPIVALILVAVFLFSVVGIVEISRKGEKKLILATTTSLYNTGILDAVAEHYRTEHGTNIHFIAVGSGQSLNLARNGDVNGVLVHAPELEHRFLTEKAVGVRKIFAYNFFAIVGPGDDPAAIKDLSPVEALTRIHRTASTWISRGDQSGTHVKEKSLWVAAGFEPQRLVGEGWYLETGTGMGATLRVAHEHGAYTLADIGTYLKYRSDGLIDLEILVEGGYELLNVYSIMVVNPSDHPHLDFDETVRFIEFLVSDEGQDLISEFGVSDYGRPLFYPAARLLEENTDPVLANWIREYAFLDNSECPPAYRFGREELYT